MRSAGQDAPAGGEWMFGVQRRAGHYAILAVAHLVMTLPNLGAHSLWDMDEGVNAESAREMLESGNWITPYFNYEVRTSKPAMSCWIIGLSYKAFGVNEFAARFPSVLFGLASVVVAYEFGRRLFSATTGLLSALILASCIEFCVISHAVTPDPPLVFFLLLALFIYWIGFETGNRWWPIPFGVLAGLAVLTKGPIGIGMPCAIVVGHLLWTRRRSALRVRPLLLGALAFILTAGPWYGLVTLDTKGKWVEVFLLNENLNRFSQPSDGHAGGVYYHAVAVIVLFGPWAVFLPAALWYGVRAARNVNEAGDQSSDKYRFLIVWFFAFLLIFSLAATKLPNYLVPAYPAIALLTGRFLDRWRAGDLAVPKWITTEALVATAFIGICMIVGLLVASGTVPLPIRIKGFQQLPALLGSAPIGVVPLAMAIVCGGLIRKRRLDAAVSCFAVGAVICLAFVGAVPPAELDGYKAPKFLAEEVGLRQTDRDIRIASCRWMRHSMVFYVRREVTRIDDFDQVDKFLAVPRPAYVLVPENEWEKLSPELTVPHRVIARKYDFYARRNILVVANRYAAPG
jgi:4-amino-4-deoxy-L-arabinose transferase-like glycosyltransferase